MKSAQKRADIFLVEDCCSPFLPRWKCVVTILKPYHTKLHIAEINSYFPFKNFMVSAKDLLLVAKASSSAFLWAKPFPWGRSTSGKCWKKF